MKQKIHYGLFNAGAVTLTIILWIIFIAIFVLYWVLSNEKVHLIFFWILVGTVVLMALSSFFAIPVSVSVDDENINIHKFRRTNQYNIKDIKSIEPTKVSRWDLRKYRGRKPLKYYTGGDGEYYIYYGSPKNPVLIKFKDGERLIIGSSNQKELIDFINQRIQND